MTNLLDRAVLRSLLLGQGRTVLASLLTVALGVSLAFGIRIGTRSAQRGLESDLAALVSKTWVGPLRFSGSEGPTHLGLHVSAYPGFMASEKKILLRGERTDESVTLLWVGQVWDANSGLAEQSAETGNLSETAGLSLVLRNLSQAYVSPSKVQGGEEKKDALLLADRHCEQRFHLTSTIVLPSGQVVPVRWRFADLGLGGCEQIFSGASPLGTVAEMDVLYLQAKSALEAAQLSTALRGTAAQLEGVSYRDMREQLADLDQLTESMEINLQLMGFVSLFIGIFMVNHVLSVLVMRQSQSLSILRATGISLFRILRPLFLFVFFLALGSGVLGALGGLLIGRGISFLASRSFAELYEARIDPLYFSTSLNDFVVVFLLSLFTCVVGAVWPLYRLQRMALAQTLHSGSWHEVVSKPHALYGWLRFLAAALLIWVLLSFPLHIDRQPVSAYVACFVILLGAVLCVRPTLAFVSEFASRFSVRVPFWLRFRLNVPLSSAVMVEVLMLCFSLTVAVRMMSASFRSSLESWVEDTLKADVWVRSRVGSEEPLPLSVREDLLELERRGQAKAVDGLRVLQAQVSVARDKALIEAFPIAISAVSLEAQSRVEPLRVLEFLPGKGFKYWGKVHVEERPWSQPDDALLSQSELSRWMIEMGTSCEGTEAFPCPSYMSQSLAVRLEQRGVSFRDDAFHTHILVSLEGRRIHLFPVAIFHDFGNDSGSLLLDAPLLSRLLDRDVAPGFMNVYLEPEVRARGAALIEELESKWASREGGGTIQAVEIFSGLTLRQRIMRSFEETFAITDALYILSGLVAFVTVLCTLGLQLLMRGQEWTIMWATTWSLPRLRRQLSLWSGHVSLLAFVLSLPVGLALGAVLVLVVNRYAFGFILELDFPYVFALILAPVAWLAGFLGAMWTTRNLARRCQPQSLHPE